MNKINKYVMENKWEGLSEWENFKLSLKSIPEGTALKSR